ncbi:MAG: hypothetical protein M3Q16_04940 [Pseudomonadota bacterium]|nr:hypothetical protein [Pseudomonadota bacterium]
MNLVTKQNASTERRVLYHGRVSTRKTLLGLFGAPASWVAQMSLIEPIAAYACYPHQVPLSAPLWADLPAVFAIISLVCLAAGLLSGYVAWNSWRRTRHQLARGGNGEHVIEVDEGQSRFLAMLAMMSSFVFIVAIVFTSCAVLLVSPCSAWI